MIRAFRGKRPQIDESAFIADNATVIGDVVIGPRSSVWFGTVIRGDVHHIRIGAETSVQDNSVIHVTHDRYPTLVTRLLEHAQAVLHQTLRLLIVTEGIALLRQPG